MLLEEGTKAPDFTLLDDQEESFTLSEILTSNQVVLYFYPKDMTPGCTIESCNFRDVAAIAKKKKALIVGVSKDSTEKHRKFKDKYQLNFPLLSDPEGKICEAYGVWQEKKFLGKKFKGIARTTFIIAQDQSIKKVFANVKVKGHSEEVLSSL